MSDNDNSILNENAFVLNPSVFASLLYILLHLAFLLS